MASLLRCFVCICPSSPERAIKTRLFLNSAHHIIIPSNHHNIRCRNLQPISQPSNSNRQIIETSLRIISHSSPNNKSGLNYLPSARNLRLFFNDNEKKSSQKKQYVIMKRISFHLALCLFLLLQAASTFAQAETDDDRTLSPYFFVQSDDPTDQMPLKSTTADVNIAGVIADVTIRQVYKK